jgi:RNA polymerase nonessential primary-like sigma factor
MADPITPEGNPDTFFNGTSLASPEESQQQITGEFISKEFAEHELSENGLTQKELTQKELSQKELSQKELPPAELAEKNFVEKDPAGNDATRQNRKNSNGKKLRKTLLDTPAEDKLDEGVADNHDSHDSGDDDEALEEPEELLLEMDGIAESSKAGKAASEDGLDATTLYLNEIGFIPLLTAEQEVQVARETVQGSRSSKHRMIESNLRLVVAIAKRFQNRGLCLLDMIEEGNIGLMRAVEKYNPELGYRFSTYATWWIKQAIDRALMNHSQTIRFPIHVMKDIQHCVRCSDQLRELLGREPSMDEIAELSARPVEQVKKLMALHIKICSADQMVADDSESSLVDQLPSQSETQPDQIAEEQNLQENMAHWVSRLSKRHRDVVIRRFGLNGFADGTLEDVGRDVGITRERVRQLQIEALVKLRRMMERDGFSPEQLED